ncbi:MAG TPA: hypothetical protein VEU96_26280, partial [Bryobacteraceae bacterium]|nr:hypothetical protein [Bryobacteraceae bacterium]
MFGDAFAAEEAQALRATGDGFPEFVVETALLDCGGNGFLLRVGRTPWSAADALVGLAGRSEERVRG